MTFLWKSWKVFRWHVKVFTYNSSYGKVNSQTHMHTDTHTHNKYDDLFKCCGYKKQQQLGGEKVLILIPPQNKMLWKSLAYKFPINFCAKIKQHTHTHTQVPHSRIHKRFRCECMCVCVDVQLLLD